MGSTPFGGQDVHHGTLHIRGVQKVDAGQYTCVASSPAGTATGTVSLKVGGESAFQSRHYLQIVHKVRPSLPLTEDPLFSEAPADLMAKIGENVTLRCSARGSPQPTVTWHRHDGRQILSGSRGRTVQLQNGHLLIQGEFSMKHCHSRPLAYSAVCCRTILPLTDWYDGNFSANALKILLKLLLFY